MDIPEDDLLSETTLKNSFNKVATFLKWCNQNGYSKSNLEKPLRNVIKKTLLIQDQRNVFTEDDLKKLFMNDYYEKKKFTKASHYWIPLLGLFTGARENELCELYVEDVQKEDDRFPRSTQ